MRRLVSICALLVAIVWATTLSAAMAPVYVPALADIMTSAQFRHIRLWFAGKNKNWELARYELRQVTQSLDDAVSFYHGIPVEFVSATTDPLIAIGDAIKAKNSAQFAKGFKELTAACNSCHKAIGRAFIDIQVPTTQPFSNQSFVPPKAP
jgi:hypothetical protein